MNNTSAYAPVWLSEADPVTFLCALERLIHEGYCCDFDSPLVLNDGVYTIRLVSDNR